MAETSKAKARRLKDGFYDKYIVGKSVIDVGVGRQDTHDGADPICDHAEMHDKDICDAHTMEAYKDNSFDTVYASHILEHMEDPITALRSWFRICAHRGHIIISVPHRDLYERKKTLPSKWNLDHKFFILENESEPPNTLSLLNILRTAFNDNLCHLVDIRTINTCTNTDKPEEHADGEFSIEAIIYKY